MKEKFVLTKNSFNTFLGLEEDHMDQLNGGLRPVRPYIPTGGGGPDLPLEEEHKPMHFCMDGYRWDNVLNKCVKA